MRVIPFPSRRDAELDAAVLAELEAAFDGDDTGSEAEAWRELRADVRSLVAPIDPAFRRSLEHQLRNAQERPARGARRLPRWLGGVGARRQRTLVLGGALALLATLIVAGAELGSGGTTSPGPVSHQAPSTPVLGTNGQASRQDEFGPARPSSATKSGESSAGAASTSSAAAAAVNPRSTSAGSLTPGVKAAGAPGETTGRLQQLSASISLGTGGAGVQALADRVGQLAVASGGFVESSKVELQRGSAGEATLTLKVPSAKLAGMLANLQRLAPVRAETQELQDLTGSYDAVTARLAAARREREALLHALAGAETATAIESLHQRIAQADDKITAGERQQASISRTASESQVEVTVLGEAAQASGGLTLGRGLHDAGQILTVSVAALLIALAVLIPFTLLLGALLLGARGWRRQQRERALDTT
jgi:Domain of unknown function (DUF4349)